MGAMLGPYCSHGVDGPDVSALTGFTVFFMTFTIHEKAEFGSRGMELAWPRGPGTLVREPLICSFCFALSRRFRCDDVARRRQGCDPTSNGQRFGFTLGGSCKKSYCSIPRVDRARQRWRSTWRAISLSKACNRP